MTALDMRLEQLKSGERYRRVEGRNLGCIAIEKTASDPDRIVVIDAVRSLSRSQMLDDAQRLGGALLARGVAPGATIGFQLPNWWEACVINLAAVLFGFRLAPLLTIYRAAELGFMLPACEVEAIFIPERYRDTDFPGLLESLPQAPTHVFTVRGDGSAANSFEKALQHAPAEPSPASADDLKLILFTSGSTGRPKGVTQPCGIRRTDPADGAILGNRPGRPSLHPFADRPHRRFDLCLRVPVDDRLRGDPGRPLVSRDGRGGHRRAWRHLHGRCDAVPFRNGRSRRAVRHEPAKSSPLRVRRG